MEHQVDHQNQGLLDVQNPDDSQELRLGVEVEISRSCSLHLHALLDAVSVSDKNKFHNQSIVTAITQKYNLIKSPQVILETTASDKHCFLLDYTHCVCVSERERVK